MAGLDPAILTGTLQLRREPPGSSGAAAPAGVPRTAL